MRKPRVGLTCDFDTRGRNHPYHLLYRAYTEALVRAGALPIPLPLLDDPADREALLELLDGVVFTGGDDLSPARYGQPPAVDTLVLLHPDRERCEWALAERARARGANVLAICAGAQLFNVLYGGTLYQDLAAQFPGAVAHGGRAPDYPWHGLEFERGAWLAELWTPPARVLSHHHQGVARLGAGLRPLARAPDGLIEAFELPDRRFGLAVQWHPELAGDEAAAALFARFVAACR